MAFSIAQQYFINLLRSQITHRYQKAAGSSFELNAKLGDEELWEDLRLGLNYFNTTPPIITTYKFADLYNASQQAADTGGDPMAPENESAQSILITSVMMCALFFTGLRLQWFEAGKHFRYNDNGISMERVKQADYQNIASANILQYMQTVLPNIRKSLGFQRLSIKGQWSSTISFPRSLTRGLRGTRLGTGM